jgi:ubiquinone/menaquinone biosynthesis C-methylase UbiE
VEPREAVALIRAAVVEEGGTWADLGAGTGVFTRALASLVGRSGTVYAVDRDASGLRELARAPRGGSAAAIRTMVGDFSERLDLPRLDGVVVANALHYIPYAEQARVMRDVASLVMDGGPIVVVEYDRREANRWVPYPISPSALARLAADAGLSPPELLATRPSRFSGTIYSAVVRRKNQGIGNWE